MSTSKAGIGMGLAGLLFACQSTQSAVPPPPGAPERQAQVSDRGARDMPATASLPLTKASAAGMDTAQLARALLGESFSMPLTGHELNKSTFADGPLGSVYLFPAGRTVGADLCRRDALVVRLVPVEGLTAETSRRDAPVRKESVGEKLQIALAPGCTLPKGGRFAWVQDATWEQAAAALRHLAALQRKARGTGELGATLRCTDEWNGDRCAGGPKAVLARLPLHQVFIVQEKGEAGRRAWEFAVMPQEPGQPFWDVELEDKAGGLPELRMHWGAPAPF